MPEVTIQQTVITTLELTKEEHKWLQENLQNPLHGDHPDEEDNYDAKMRRRFFEALKNG